MHITDRRRAMHAADFWRVGRIIAAALTGFGGVDCSIALAFCKLFSRSSRLGLCLSNKQKHSTSASARRTSDKRGEGNYSYVQHPASFSKATSPSLIVCLYLAYSKLLKLTAASNAGSVSHNSDR